MIEWGGRVVGTLIVDDQEDIRILLRFFIEQANGGLHVVGEAANGIDAVKEADRCDPQVIVLDQMMPGLTGIEAARAIRARRPGQKIVLCSAFLNEDVIREAHEVGIAHCIGKLELEKVPELVASL